MRAKKNGLEIRMETTLEKFREEIHDALETGRIKDSNPTGRVIKMLSKLQDYKQIHTVEEFYSAINKDVSIYRLKGGYGKKTWLKLNEILTECDLPSIRLPYKDGQENQLEMGTKRNGLEIRMETDLEEFREEIKNLRYDDSKKLDLSTKEQLNSVIGMLYRLYDGHDIKGLVPRQINTVGELYNFSEYEIFNRFRGYGKKHGQG